MIRIRLAAATVVMALCGATGVQAQEQNGTRPQVVGVVEYARGMATLQGDAQNTRIVAKGERFNRNDVITTGKKSFAILKLTDGTRLTLRPNSQFAVEEFNPSLDKNASASLRLFRGGLRTVTGFISKYNKRGYNMRTPVATIGIRGTEFDARLCDKQCKAEEKNLKPVDTAAPKAIGRLAFIRGQVAARNRDGSERGIISGSPVYEGDTLLSGKNTFAVVAFRDRSRVTLQPRTQFQIQSYRYNPDKPENNVAVMGLLRGGLRAVTGVIGKLDRDKYSMRTPVATIGIRGTGYDLQCKGRCQSFTQSWHESEGEWWARALDYVIASAHAAPTGDGLFATVWQGAIDLQQGDSSQLLEAGQFAFIANSNMPPQLLSVGEVPRGLVDNPAPRPDQVDINEDELFAELDQGNADAGLYVSVYDGHVTMQGEAQVVEIGAGEAAYSSSDGATTVRLNEQPQFMLQDWVPNPANITDANWLQELPGEPGSSLECEII